MLAQVSGMSPCCSGRCSMIAFFPRAFSMEAMSSESVVV